ncbi:MAG: endonuclease domain-containing protein [Reyranella sp.]
MPQKRIERARDLRHTSTRPEQIVWELLRAHRMAGVKFCRQHPIGPYYADFACASKKLVIEIDGDHHAFQVEADARRTSIMGQQGWRVVRLAANYVVENPEGVWLEIERLLRDGL